MGTPWRWGPGCEGQLCRALCSVSPEELVLFITEVCDEETATGPHDATERTVWFQVKRLESYPLGPTFQKVLTPVCHLRCQCFPVTSFYSVTSNSVSEECAVHAWTQVKLFSILVEKISSYIFYCFAVVGGSVPFKWFQARKRHSEICMLESSLQRQWGRARYILLLKRFNVSKSLSASDGQAGQQRKKTCSHSVSFSELEMQT